MKKPPGFKDVFGKKDKIVEETDENGDVSSPNSQTRMINTRKISQSDNGSTGFERNSQELDYHLRFSPQNTSEAKAILLIGRNLLIELEKLTDHLEAQAVSSNKVDDWKFAAMVLDRVFLYIFTILMILAMSMTILTSPGLYSTPEATA